MVAYFQLQPAESELQQLAEQYWQKSGEKEHELEKAAFEAGEAIRNGDYSLANLEAIVRWKSECAVQYLIGNSNQQVRHVLAIAAAPESSTESGRQDFARTPRRRYFPGVGDSGRHLPRALHGARLSCSGSGGLRPARRSFLQGVSGLLQAAGRQQHPQAAERSPRSRTVAHARSCVVGVVA
jgi:hypothetical protein